MAGNGGIFGGIATRLRAALASPYAPLWIIGAALLLLLPGLFAGLLLDDYAHAAMLRRDGSFLELERAPWNLYAFLLDDDAWRAAVRDRGVVPWFADPELRATFFRPLSSLSLYLDTLLWPGDAILPHLHSFAWYALLVLAVSRIHRRLFAAPWLAGLATLLYAIDDAHGFPTAWLANRNALIATALGAVAVELHMAWRQTSRKRYALAAPLVFGLGLLGGEAALGLAAYPLAYALTLDRARLGCRLASLAPLALVIVVWRIAYDQLGYGAGGSDLYIDPGADPLAFLGAAAQRLPELLMGQLTLLPSQAGFLAPDGIKPAVAAVAAFAVLLVGFLCRRLLRRSATARFAGLGMLLSTVPMASTFPHDRLLFGAGIGAFALVAETIAARRDPEKGSRPLAAFFVAAHLVVAPLALPLNAYSTRLFANAYRASATTFDRLGDLRGRTVVVVNGPDFFFACWPPVFRAQMGLEPPRDLRVLGTTLESVGVTRAGADTLRLTPRGGYVSSPLDKILRRADLSFVRGQRFDLGDVVITVEALTADGRPASILARFPGGLDDPRYVWTAWWPDGYRPFAIPPEGGTATLPPFELADMLRIGFGGDAASAGVHP